MNRRKFIQQTSLAGLILPSFILDACSAKTELSSSVVADYSDDFEFNEATIGQLQELMQSGKQTSRSITQAYLDRINLIDKGKEIRINSVIEINPEVLTIADELDKER